MRFWDVNGEYTGGLLRFYRYWAVEISYRQHTLGSFIIFSRSEGARLISDLKPEAIAELPLVMCEVEHALRAQFAPDHFNYLQMGNGVPFLHFHGIPRYVSERQFFGKIWKDETWGHPPAWTYEVASIDLVTSLRDALLPLLR